MKRLLSIVMGLGCVFVSGYGLYQTWYTYLDSLYWRDDRCNFVDATILTNETSKWTYRKTNLEEVEMIKRIIKYEFVDQNGINRTGEWTTDDTAELVALREGAEALEAMKGKKVDATKIPVRYLKDDPAKSRVTIERTGLISTILGSLFILLTMLLGLAFILVGILKNVEDK